MYPSTNNSVLARIDVFLPINKIRSESCYDYNFPIKIKGNSHFYFTKLFINLLEDY